MKKTVCKFSVHQKVDSTTHAEGEKPSVSLSAGAVTGGSQENDEFFTATPNGTLVINTVNPEALEGIDVGDEILITIEKAPAAEETASSAGGGE
jgi:hypothetical protein